MKIHIRQACGKFVEIKVEIGSSLHDLGFHDKKEAQEIASTLLSASLEIQEISESIPWKTESKT